MYLYGVGRCASCKRYEQNYEFPKEASNKIVLKSDSTEWYLVEKVANTLVLVDKDTLASRNYRYKFVELKDVEQMESKLWQNLKKHLRVLFIQVNSFELIL